VAATAAPKEPTLDVSGVESLFKLDKAKLWKGSVFPKTEGTNGLVSGSAAYWQMLKGLPDEAPKAWASLRDQLAGLNARAAWFAAKEGDVALRDAKREYGRRSPYQIPRIKGTYALHQLRLLLGNETFLKAMDAAFTANANRDVTAEELVASLSRAAGATWRPSWLRGSRRRDSPTRRSRPGRRRTATPGPCRSSSPSRARRTTSSGAWRSTLAGSAS